MWSVGVLTYMLLGGVSPFYAAGGGRKQTLQNVANVNWSFGKDLFKSVSHDAKDFIEKLLLRDPKERLTAKQALSHPWLHYAAEMCGNLGNPHGLLELHSRDLWHKQARRNEPWSKLTKIERMLAEDDEDPYEKEKGSWRPASDLSIDGRQMTKPKQAVFSDDRERASAEPQASNCGAGLYYYGEDDDERLNPGTYLLPVKDPLFTVRLREYRRNRYEKVRQIESLLFYKQRRDEQRSKNESAQLSSTLSTSPSQVITR